jgi:hypothetical protein
VATRIGLNVILILLSKDNRIVLSYYNGLARLGLEVSDLFLNLGAEGMGRLASPRVAD